MVNPSPPHENYHPFSRKPSLIVFKISKSCRVILIKTIVWYDSWLLDVTSLLFISIQGCDEMCHEDVIVTEWLITLMWPRDTRDARIVTRHWAGRGEHRAQGTERTLSWVVTLKPSTCASTEDITGYTTTNTATRTNIHTIVCSSLTYVKQVLNVFELLYSCLNVFIQLPMHGFIYKHLLNTHNPHEFYACIIIHK